MKARRAEKPERTSPASLRPRPHGTAAHPPAPPAKRGAPPRPDPKLGARLLTWYDAHRRDLPWRGTTDPYAVWVSEVMLQQTQVKTVLGYFDAWMRRFPDVRALARARVSDVLHAWQGLGYYSRARRLHEGARAVVARHGGVLPRDHQALLALPGIGAYSAGAIASIAFGLREPLVDGNVVRVLTRRFGLRGDPGKAPLKRELWSLAAELVPPDRPGDFNQALMELGATVCTPRAPACASCPLRSECVARRAGLSEALPELPPRGRATRVRVAATLLTGGDRVLVCRLGPEAPRWAGLWTFPHVELRPRETPRAAAARAALELARVHAVVGAERARFVHTITRFRIELAAYEATLGDGARRSRLAGGARFVRLDELDGLAMPAPHRRLARLLLDAPRAS